MQSDQHRYFIELQPAAGATVPRNREDEIRREQAAHFITAIYAWLKNNALGDKVSAVAMTAFGQVQITCEADVISRLSDEEELQIAAIRPSALYVEGMGRRF
ncbi:MAG: hypothetical protein SFW62_07255 [Alphaproteobacteria bacterium]|nr:hypothetical protein [Alphaproteobacteria bacterium]